MCLNINIAYILSECCKITAMYVTVILWHLCLTTFAWQRTVLHIFNSKQLCKYLATDGVNLQSAHQSFLKILVCDASCCIAGKKGIHYNYWDVLMFTAGRC